VKFQTLALVRHPLTRVWNAMRDELPQLVDHLEDIESITTTDRIDEPGVVSMVNIWRAKPKLPEFLVHHIDAAKFAWTDRAIWNEASKTCIWHIEPHLFGSYCEISGETRFEPAMGGLGTRTTFSIEAEIKLGAAGDGIRKVFEETLFKGATSFAQGIIAKNFRKMADALGAYLDAKDCASSAPLPGGAATTKRGK
jgi:hypothetical protein